MGEKHSMRNFYPILRECTPNVAIYFTVYEETKNILGFHDRDYGHIFRTCLASGALGGFCAYLPMRVFNPFIPLQFGLHFSIFEVAKQMIKNNTGKETLNVMDVGSTAVLGGFLGSCVTFPLMNMLTNWKTLNFGYVLQGNTLVMKTSLYTNFAAHCVRMTPL